MEQQANQPQEQTQEQESGAPMEMEMEMEMEVEVELGDPRQEFEALKGDYEALLMDVRRLYQAIKAANYPQKVLDAGKEHVSRAPFATVLGAFALGLLISRFSERRM